LRVDTASNAHNYTYPNSHPYAERNRPSYRNSDAERLPRRRVHTITISNPVPHGYTNANSHTNVDGPADTIAKSNGDTFAFPGSGLEYLDPAAR
jgi:hypothetical protein